MKIKRSVANQLLTALEFKNVEKWTDSRMAGKLNKLASTIDTDTQLEDEELDEILTQVMEACEAGTEIEVTGDEEEGKPTKKTKKAAPAEKPAKKAKKAAAPVEEEETEEEEEAEEEEEEVKPAKKTKKAAKPAAKKTKKAAPAEEAEEEAEEESEEEEEAKPAKKTKKAAAEKPAAKPAKKEKTENKKDKWGSRVGTQAADINSLISKKGHTVEEIAEALSLPAGRVRSHLYSVTQKGVCEKDDKNRYKMAS